MLELIAGGALHSHVAVHASRSEERPPLHDWSAVAACESGGDWHIDTGNGYEGGLQFLNATWLANGGGEYAAHAYNATPTEQVIVAERVLQHSSWTTQWPVCGRYLEGLRRPAGQLNSSTPVRQGEGRTMPNPQRGAA